MIDPAIDMAALQHNYQHLTQRIAQAAVDSGRGSQEVALIAVSKGQPLEAIRALYALGHRDFGESYVQEWQTKAQELSDLPDLRWHFLGHLQRNKVRHVIGKVHLLHSLDDMQGLDEMARTAWQLKLTQPVLLQVNLAQEESKRGCGPDDAALFLEVLQRSPGLQLRGLMVLPPYDWDADRVRPWFRQLRELSEQLQQTYAGQGSLPPRGSWLLSMGMSGDFEAAIAEGATHIRIGTALFGPRLPRH
jgi:pyridoxal phosphate enzyme (YggS family)